MIPEEKFIEIFDTLPEMSIGGGSYKPIFDFGSQEDLLHYLNQKNNQSYTKYPLVWIETPFSSTGKERLSIKSKLILATLSNGKISNRERLELTFKPTLYPLLANVKKALNHSGMTRILEPDKNVQINFFKYNVDKEGNFASDIWDAIKFECDLEMKDCPLRTINY